MLHNALVSLWLWALSVRDVRLSKLNISKKKKTTKLKFSLGMICNTSESNILVFKSLLLRKLCVPYKNTTNIININEKMWTLFVRRFYFLCRFNTTTDYRVNSLKWRRACRVGFCQLRICYFSLLKNK